MQRYHFYLAGIALASLLLCQPATGDDSTAAQLDARNQTIRHLVTRLKDTHAAYAELSAAYKQQQFALDQLQRELAATQRQLAEVQQQPQPVAPPPEPLIGPTTLATKPMQPLLSQALQADANGDTEQAIWYYRQILAAEPLHYDALVLLGHQLVQRGEDTAAETVLMRAFRMNPDDPGILQNLGIALLRQEQVQMAVAMLARAVALAPDDAKAHQNLALACQSLGWRDAAEQHFQQAATLDAKLIDPAYNLAVLYATSTPPRLEAARKWYKTARQRGLAPDPGLEAVLEQ